MSTSVLTERGFAEIIAENGGRVFRVGGCVRDQFMGVTAKDIDFSVVGMVKKNFKELFPEAQEIGKSFPVFLLKIDGVKREVAFARTEKKIGPGYKGFRVSAKPKITIEEDLFRRDTTVNSMAQDSLTGEVIDPFGGKADIEAKVLRATSEHFSDDPMRALRLAGHAARFEFAIDIATLPLMRATNIELAEEPVERMVAELGKVLPEAKQPGRFFRVLAQTKLLSVTFKELAVLPPEAFAKGMERLDAVANVTNNAKLRFAALGTVLTKEMLIAWNKRMTLHGDWLDAAITVSEAIVFLQEITADKIVDTMNKLRRGCLNLEELDLITQAAQMKIPQLGSLKAVMTVPKDVTVPSHLQGKEIGEWLKTKQVELLARHLELNS